MKFIPYYTMHIIHSETGKFQYRFDWIKYIQNTFSGHQDEAWNQPSTRKFLYHQWLIIVLSQMHNFDFIRYFSYTFILYVSTKIYRLLRRDNIIKFSNIKPSPKNYSTRRTIWVVIGKCNHWTPSTKN